MSDDWRIIIALNAPPHDWGFKPAKSGKSWWRRVNGIFAARQIATELVKLNIHGRIKKAEPMRSSPAAYAPRADGVNSTFGAHPKPSSRFRSRTKRR